MDQNPLADTAMFAKIAYADGISPKNQQTQLGVHFEEVAEMIATLQSDRLVCSTYLALAHQAMCNLATYLKGAKPGAISIADRLEFLDSICDQLVTATLSAVLYDMDPVNGLNEVNRSNFSKLVNGVMQKTPDTAKWVKGPGYTKPDLTPYV